MLKKNEKVATVEVEADSAVNVLSRLYVEIANLCDERGHQPSGIMISIDNEWEENPTDANDPDLIYTGTAYLADMGRDDA